MKAFFYIGILFALTISITSCVDESPTNYDTTLHSSPESLTFFVIGDWGRDGNNNQQRTAAEMNAAAIYLQPNFIISTGDNIYANGVQSVNDSHWKSSFEDVYDGANINIPWYVVLGNHDYQGNVQAEIDYSGINQQWNLPSRYYSFLQNLPDNSTALFIFLDTNQFESDYYNSPNQYPDLVNTEPSLQIEWLKQLLKDTNADWIIVTGHHPVYTGGGRRNARLGTKLILKPIFDQYNVDAYFCGHEHDLQHLKDPGNSTNYFVSGAGSNMSWTGTISQTLFSVSTNGFVAISLNKNEMTVQFIADNDDVIYRTSIVK